MTETASRWNRTQEGSLYRSTQFMEWSL